jgi:hypothetical protein
MHTYSRRQALGLGLGAGLGLALVGLLPVDEELVLNALSDAFFAAPGLPLPSELRAGHHALRHMAHLHPAVRLQLKGLLSVMERGAGFSGLSLEGRRRLLGELADSERATPRMAVNGLRQLCAIATFRHPSLWPAIGYDGPTIGGRAWEQEESPTPGFLP